MIRSTSWTTAIVIALVVWAPSPALSSQRSQPRGDPLELEAIQKRVQEIVEAARRGEHMVLLERSGRVAGELRQVRASNPKVLWPQLLDGIRDRYLKELTENTGVLGGARGPNGLSSLLTFTAYPYRIVDIETRWSSERWPLSPDSRPVDTFLTITYYDPLTAPLIQIGFAAHSVAHLLRTATLKIVTDATTGHIAHVNTVDAGRELYNPDDVPFRTTGVAWVYSRKWLLGVKVIGATWPISVSLECGSLGSVARQNIERPRTLGGHHLVTYLEMDALAVRTAEEDCLLRVREGKGREDSIEFHVSSPVSNFACWVRPPYAPSPHLAMDRCGNVVGFLDSSITGLGPFPSKASGPRSPTLCGSRRAQEQFLDFAEHGSVPDKLRIESERGSASRISTFVVSSYF